MKMLKRFIVKKNERGLLYSEGDFLAVLEPGTYRRFDPYDRLSLESFSLNTPQFEHRLAGYLRQSEPQLVERYFTRMDLGDNEAGLRYEDGVLKVDGALAGLLQAGQYGFWRYNRQVSVELVDTRIQALEVSGQEILTRDKVSLRLNLAANWRYNDVLTAFSRLSKPLEYLYRELQFGLRAAVGTRTLDELLENKQSIDEAVSAHLAAKLEDSGLEVSGLGVRDIILPGEMKTLLAQVVEAEKAAQANVIRRREETSATRSLLNTAKVMEENPTALRLKELETLERVAERIDRISVFGGLDQVLNGLVTLKQA
ncbi:TPA: slipin family protein [Pseudomonas aeruginosa]|nr:slipin family protein [Pseudomonas aeruginosa]